MNITDTRLWTALITPFTEGGKEVDHEALGRVLQHQLDGGVKGWLLFGSTGEAAVLTNAEKSAIAKQAHELKQDANIMMGVSHNVTSQVIEQAQQAEDMGADVLLVSPPYYNKPTQEGIVKHFEALCAATTLPVVLYNIPARVSVDMSLRTVRHLAKLDNVVGVKEASANLQLTSQLYGDGDVVVWSGDDALLLPYMSVGGVGGLSVNSNLFPAQFSDIVNTYVSGNVKKAADLASKFADWYDDVFVESNPIGIKAAMAQAGLIGNHFRLPLTPMSAENTTQLKKSYSSL